MPRLLNLALRDGPGEDLYLYLHGKGGADAMSPPGDLLQGYRWPGTLVAPHLSEKTLALHFPIQVRVIRRWLGVVKAAIGHSYGGYLLIAAAQERAIAGEPTPPLLLLSSILGKSGASDQSGFGYIAPRSQRVREGLGLDGGDLLIDPERIFLAYGTHDGFHCPIGDMDRLDEIGFRVYPTASGHCLDTAKAGALVEQLCEQLIDAVIRDEE